ncbi:esterase/lipase family protein [Ornithinimicrobium pratense]|uniref:Alpha/beta hydrolase n=1 Tax=Ornithinimicrobium pratense TaxID=2593973 RepID=A0A5J6V5M2_9MICO|nr:alpha/beta hydrolase [Ornithinimicrobium pratense]QFG68614.1 alpha/beta hydrolase [Ornithinimicrobium pratense]
MTSPGRLARNAWAWLLDYRYVVHWQVRGLLDRSDPADYLDPAGSAPPVLLLPGIYERWQFLRPVADLLRDLGHPVHVLTRLRWNTAPVAASAEHVAGYLQEQDLREVLIVAHSKGGLIGKYAMLHADPEGRIARMITIATPFAGSRYARYFLARSIRAFSPRDETLRMLGEQLEVNARITSIWGAFDPHIPGGSRLEGAINVPLRTSGHFRIVGATELLDAVRDAAAEQGGQPDFGNRSSEA